MKEINAHTLLIMHSNWVLINMTSQSSSMHCVSQLWIHFFLNIAEYVRENLTFWSDCPATFLHEPIWFVYGSMKNFDFFEATDVYKKKSSRRPLICLYDWPHFYIDYTLNRSSKHWPLSGYERVSFTLWKRSKSDKIWS